MKTEQMEDSIFEALFRQAVIEEYEEEIDSIPPREWLQKQISFTPGFELRMMKLFARERRKEYLRKTLNVVKHVAAVFVITATVIFGILLFNPEVRAAVKSTVVEWYDYFTSLIFPGEPSDMKERHEWQPESLPIGYHENSVTILGRVTNIEYINKQNNTIYLSYRPEESNTNISIDNENHLLKMETVNRHEAFIAKSMSDEFDNGVIWSMDGYTFSLWSKLPIDELIRIAESIN